MPGFSGRWVHIHKAFLRRSTHGIYSILTHFSVEEEDWNRVMDINLKGTMLCFKYAAREMLKQGRGGRIIGKYACWDDR